MGRIVIAVIIIKSGIEMMRDTISQVLGERPDTSEVAAIKKAVASFPEVHGAYDLVLHDYGPDKRLGSLHIEIPDTMTAEEIDTLERHIQKKIYQEFGVILTGIGIYSMNTKNDECAKMRDHVRNMVLSHDGVLQFHGFYVNRDEKYMSFDAVLSFDCDRDAEYQAIMQEVQAATRITALSSLPTSTRAAPTTGRIRTKRKRQRRKLFERICEYFIKQIKSLLIN